MICETLESRCLLSAAASVVPLPIAGFTLVNADTNQPVSNFNLVDNSTIDLAETGRRLSIVADEGPLFTGSVRFNYDGRPDYRIENLAPYAIAGDLNGGKNYLPWTPTFGTHTLIATPYSGPRGSGARAVERCRIQRG
jgi:hypothetical protein